MYGTYPNISEAPPHNEGNDTNDDDAKYDSDHDWPDQHLGVTLICVCVCVSRMHNATSPLHSVYHIRLSNGMHAIQFCSWEQD